MNSNALLRDLWDIGSPQYSIPAHHRFQGCVFLDRFVSSNTSVSAQIAQGVEKTQNVAYAALFIYATLQGWVNIRNQYNEPVNLLAQQNLAALKLPASPNVGGSYPDLRMSRAYKATSDVDKKVRLCTYPGLID